jgi:hypothetical protein
MNAMAVRLRVACYVERGQQIGKIGVTVGDRP